MSFGGSEALILIHYLLGTELLSRQSDFAAEKATHVALVSTWGHILVQLCAVEKKSLLRFTQKTQLSRYDHLRFFRKNGFSIRSN